MVFQMSSGTKQKVLFNIKLYQCIDRNPYGNFCISNKFLSNLKPSRDLQINLMQVPKQSIMYFNNYNARLKLSFQTRFQCAVLVIFQNKVIFILSNFFY